MRQFFIPLHRKTEMIVIKGDNDQRHNSYNSRHQFISDVVL